ncbi:Uncharacterised protein [uncultured archaeon]|nr:Uncharacterised protein [uncultured archaeon]
MGILTINGIGALLIGIIIIGLSIDTVGGPSINWAPIVAGMVLAVVGIVLIFVENMRK